MNIENNIIINSSNDVLSITFLYAVDNYLTFKTKVKSDEFSGVSNFCISKEEIASIINTLSIMHSELKGICKIQDYDSDAFLYIEVQKLGHVLISGQIGGSHQEHFMKFKIKTDQTVLLNLIQTFKSLFKANA